MLGIEKVSIKDKSSGYVVHDFMLKRIGYLLVVIALCLCVGAFVTQQQIADGRVQLSKMESIVEGQKRFVDESKEALAAKERTLEWRKSIIDEKQERINGLDKTASDEIDALVAKDRTLQWKAQVVEEKQKQIKKLEARNVKQRKELFEIHKVHALGSKVAHAKLVKMMTVVQNYLTRQKKTNEILRVTNRNMNGQIRKYQKSMDTLAEDMNWQPHTKKRLKDGYNEFADQVKSLMEFSSSEIIKENAGAEKKLAEISKSLVNEINADLSEEDEDFFYTLDVEGFEDSDKIKKLQNRLTGWESTFVKLIQDFSTKVKAIPGEIDASDIPAAKNLLSNLRRGDLNFETAKVQMVAMLTKHKQRIDPNKDISQAFEEWLNVMQFAPSRELMLGKLDSWQKGEVTDFQMLVFIEDKVAKGEVPGQWLDQPTAGPERGKVPDDGEVFDPGSVEFDASSNGWKLTDVLKEAIKKAADSDDQNIVASGEVF